MMTIRKIGFFILLGMFLYVFTGCSAEKDVAERRNLMIPKKSELPRNSKYKEPTKRKTNKIKTKKRRRTKKLF
ncbi:MAG: hypothetical protein JXR41_11455 [Bacteroidales bacterium]|nr:hypothetical protein [Bacteroidales bacterium]MBN2763698.1 hypothetical protein [Bacteroidales bacterium]